MGIYDELQRIGTGSPAPKPAPKNRVKKQAAVQKESAVDRPIDQPTDPPSDQSVDRLAHRSMDRSTSLTTDVDELGPVVEKPRAFYITQKVDCWLNDAVRYLQGKGLYKVDRSVLLNALVHDPDHFQPASLDRLRGRLLAHLTNKSLRRV